MPRLKWAPDALLRAAALRAELRTKSKPYAKKVGARIRELTAHLRRHPALGREGFIPGTRELILDGVPYAIVYAYDEPNRVVIILDVVDTRMDWQ